MKLIDFTPANKDEGLRELAEQGYLLVNPTYTPVNKLPDKEADKLILENYKNFRTDLDLLIKNDEKVPIVLVKSNILRLLERPMVTDGYNVINQGLLVPFPLHYHATAFQDRLKTLLSTPRWTL
ncbi:MAG TPA: hypothetical protein VLE99_04415 [Candidatus Saccharimonadales bacterium]|nr:hypothetical protein [Candidatus Saccharimonadales bacterium]